MPETSTLSINELAQDVFDAFKQQLPVLRDIGYDLSSATAKKGDQIKARVAKLPAVSTYDGTTGYENGATEASALFVDVPVTLDQHKHVPVKLDYIDSISSKIDLYGIAVMNIGYALAKSVLDFALGKVLAANFSEVTTEPIISTSSETLGKVRKALNTRGAALIGRFGIVNSDFFEALDNDVRIASKDYYGQQTNAKPLGILRNVKGFGTVYEYPDLPANGENLSGYFGDRTGIVLATRIPNDISAVADSAGIPKIASFEVVTDAETGLSMLAIKWMKSGTFDVYVTFTLLYGVAAGSQGEGAGKIMDYAGHRVATAA